MCSNVDPVVHDNFNTKIYTIYNYVFTTMKIGGKTNLLNNVTLLRGGVKKSGTFVVEVPLFCGNSVYLESPDTEK